MITDVTGVLLAGGKSQRMGEDKRFLPIGGTTLLDRGLSAMCQLFQQVCVVIAQDSPFLQTHVPVFRDRVPHSGSLGGLYTGLREASTPYVFVAACDMPFLSLQLVKYMNEVKDETDIVVASWKDRIQPTHAFYSKRCTAILEDMIRTHDMKIQKVFQHPSLNVRFVMDHEVSRIDPEGRSFININNPVDLEAARLLHDDPTP